MKSGSAQFSDVIAIEFCSMCGAIAGDFWQTRPTRPVLLNVRPRYGDTKNLWIICDECHEGLRGLHRRKVKASRS